MSYVDVVEGVRRAQSAYAEAIDAGRSDDVAAVFTEDGVVDVEGMDPLVGRETIRRTYAGWDPAGSQRHLIANLHVTAWNEQEATATADVVLLKQGDGGWGISLVGRYEDTVRNEDGVWRFARRTTRFAGGAPGFDGDAEADR